MRYPSFRRREGREGGKGPLGRVAEVAGILWLIVGLLASPSVATVAQSGSDAVQVEHLGQSSLQVDPDSTVTTAFRVRNQSDTTRSIRSTVEVPSEWTLVTSPSPITLSGGESVVRLVSFSVPSQAPARTEPIRLDVADATSPSALDSASVPVEVQAVRALRLSLLNAAERTTAGASYVASFAVRNVGNVPAEAHLQAETPRTFRTELDTSTVVLAPSQTERVRATVWTSRVANATDSHLRLRANPRSVASDTSSMSTASGAGSPATARAAVKLIPASEDHVDRGPRFPVAMQVTTVGSHRSQVGQIRLKGAGHLGGDRSRHLEFLFRGPGQQGVSSFGRPPIYSATYTAERWTLRGGDQIYETTPLAGPRRFGVGGEARRRAGAWTLGAFAQTRRRGPSGSRFASYATYEPHSAGAVTASVVRQEGLFEGTVAAVEGRIDPWPNATLSAEAGLGRGPRGTGAGVRARLSGQHAWGNYRTRHLYASDQFPGARSGDRLSSGHLRLRLSDDAFVFGSARYKRRMTYATATPLVHQSARLGSSLSGTWQLTRWSVRVTGADEQSPFRDRQSVTLQSRLQRGKLGVSTVVEIGRSALRNASFTPFQSYRGQVSLQAAWQQFQGFAEYTKTQLRTGAPAEPRASFGLTSRTQIGPRMDLSLDAEWRNAFSRSMPDWRSASLDFQYELPFGHTVTAEARVNDFGTFTGRTSPEFRIGYDVPIGVPLASTSDGETVTGRVINAEDGTGVANVLLRLGDAQRVTDEAGRFSLPLPHDGTAYLQINRSTVEEGRIPMLDLPLPITADDGALDLEIPLHRSAALTVQVTEYEYPDLRTALRNEEPEAVGGLEDVIVEATDEQGRERRLTNAEGRAPFNHLRPGTWTIRLVNPQPQQGAVVEQDAYSVTVEPGEQKELEVRVLPQRREVELRKKGALELDSDSE